jgi:membrane-bound serine protease (ClpP class)
MRRIRVSVVGLVLSVALLSACSDSAPSGAVHVVKLDGAIGPITERFIDRALDRAENDSASLVVIELDTPGGLDLSMRAIVKRIERSSVPIAVYVYPPGGRAASAGTFITMAGHLAVMAPNTSIGAASAINADGSDIQGTLGKKVENDAVAFIRGIAELRGRNADWAEQAVREAAAVNQSKAAELGVVDFVANDLDDLLRQADGRTLQLRPNVTVTLEGLAQAPRVTTSMTLWEHFLDFLADPTIASLLISLGFLALLIEIASPGLIVPGTVGVIAIILGFLGFGVLPVDTAGLVLILLGLGMVALELFAPGGILGVSGAVAITLGAIIAFRDTPADLRPPVWLLVVLVVVLVGAFVSMAYAVARMRGVGVLTGAVALVGHVAIARSPLTPYGWVFIQGERWLAQLEGGEHAEPGDRLRITGTDGLQLRVRKENEHD